jgi:hypothetical protein
MKQFQNFPAKILTAYGIILHVLFKYDIKAKRLTIQDWKLDEARYEKESFVCSNS